MNKKTQLQMAMGNKRFEICFLLLKNKKMTPKEIMLLLNMKAPAISHQLNKMIDAGIAKRESKSIYSYYTLDEDFRNFFSCVFNLIEEK